MSVATTKVASSDGALRWLPLYLGFAATGVGVALPGVLLPVLLSSWHLADEQGGLLFLMAWLGSASGALLVRGPLRRVLIVGASAIVASSVLMATCAGHGAYAWMLLYGFGLGLTMTSVSLIRQRQAGADSGTELVRLNLLWAVGALVCPSLAAHSLASARFEPMLWTIGGLFLPLAAWAALSRELTFQADAVTERRPWHVFQRIPIPLILVTALITGVEASAGGWLATYAKREGHHLAAMLAAPTCFWAGLVCSRVFWSRRQTLLSERAIVRTSLALLTAASAVLYLGGSNTGAMLTTAFLAGFGIGPVYPLLLSWDLRFHRSGTIFFLAGVGAAALPWITGVVSTRWHSLQLGFAVPFAASALMLGISLTAPLRRWAETPSTTTRLD